MDSILSTMRAEPFSAGPALGPSLSPAAAGDGEQPAAPDQQQQQQPQPQDYSLIEIGAAAILTTFAHNNLDSSSFASTVPTITTTGTGKDPSNKKRKRSEGTSKAQNNKRQNNSGQEGPPPSPQFTEGGQQGPHQPRCHWSTCTVTLEKTEDLLPHISKQHLTAHRIVSVVPAEKDISDPMKFEPFATAPGEDDQSRQRLAIPGQRLTVACHWADCDYSYASPVTPSLSDGGGTLVGAEEGTTLGSRSSSSSRNSSPEVDAVAQRGFEELVKHLCTAHLGKEGVAMEDPHACMWKDCVNRFKTFEDLSDHIANIHVPRGQSTYVCLWDSCARQLKPFAQRQKIIRHLQTHTGDKPFECTVCHQRFSDESGLPQHMRTHTGEKPFKCVVEEGGCGKEFAIAGALRIHRRLHTGEKPFACREEGCDKRFAESSNLTKHVRVHTGEKPFQCTANNCGKKFARPDQVSRHLKTHADAGGKARK
ncbi:hypothetical protein HK101_000196 [Irineochytrium annulatum]|nr:hypothetical protein HK101_000196 [Irineochytrium annulatum]